MEAILPEVGRLEPASTSNQLAPISSITLPTSSICTIPSAPGALKNLA